MRLLKELAQHGVQVPHNTNPMQNVHQVPKSELHPGEPRSQPARKDPPSHCRCTRSFWGPSSSSPSTHLSGSLGPPRKVPQSFFT